MSAPYEVIEKGTPDFPIGLFAQTIYYSFPHHHIEYELFYIDEGECIFGIEGVEYMKEQVRLNKASELVLNSAVPVEVEDETETKTGSGSGAETK